MKLNAILFDRDHWIIDNFTLETNNPKNDLIEALKAREINWYEASTYEVLDKRGNSRFFAHTYRKELKD